MSESLPRKAVLERARRELNNFLLCWEATHDLCEAEQLLLLNELSGILLLQLTKPREE